MQLASSTTSCSSSSDSSQRGLPRCSPKSRCIQQIPSSFPTLSSHTYSVAIAQSLRWAVFAAHMGFNYGFYFLTNWSPTYYADVLKLSPAESGIHLAVAQVHFSDLLHPRVSSHVSGYRYSWYLRRKSTERRCFSLRGTKSNIIYILQDIRRPWLRCLAPARHLSRGYVVSRHEYDGRISICTDQPLIFS